MAGRIGASSSSSPVDEDLYPKFTPNLFYSPGKKLFQAFATLKGGGSAPLSSVLASIEPLVIVMRIELDKTPKGENYRLTLFLQSRQLSTTKVEIEKALFSSPFVISSKVAESRQGLLVDTFRFPLMATSGTRSFLAAQKVIDAIFTKIREKFGSGGDVIIYDEGYAFGEEQGAVLLSFFAKDMILEALPDFVKLYQSVGLGRPVLVKEEFGPGATIKMYDSLECEGKESMVPYSQFIRGHIAGLTSKLYGRPMKCRETKCIASGNEYCEFQIEAA